MSKVNPAEFVRQVRQEFSRIIWPTRKETTITAMMVVAMVIIMAMFFLLVDFGLSSLMKLIFSFGV